VSALAKQASSEDLDSLAALLPHVDRQANLKLEGASSKERVEAVAQAVNSLVDDLGLTTKIGSLKVPKDDLPGIGKLSRAWRNLKLIACES
jgi:alcohol dehydrogenase class IV